MCICISHRMEEVLNFLIELQYFENGKYIDTVNTKMFRKDIISMMIIMGKY